MTTDTEILQALDAAEALAAQQQWRAAIDLLANHIRPLSPEDSLPLLMRWIELRARAFEQTDWPANPAPWPPAWHDRFPPDPYIPEIPHSALDANTLASGVLGHGALLVRNLVPREQATRLAAAIDHSVTLRDAHAASGQHKPVPSPGLAHSPYLDSHHKLGVGRKFITETGGIWAVDAPAPMFAVMALYEQLGLRDLLQQYFGEAPCVSVRKWVLRRVSPLPAEPDWHQDGAFMGTGVRSVNLWIALNSCGGDTDTPGIDLVPKRLDHIVPTGSHGARFDWTVGPALVPEAFPDAPAVRPLFEPGDALFFDHFNLHRTAYAPHIRQNRYAIECWFFAASLNAANQIPLFF